MSEPENEPAKKKPGIFSRMFGGEKTSAPETSTDKPSDIPEEIEPLEQHVEVDAQATSEPDPTPDLSEATQPAAAETAEPEVEESAPEENKTGGWFSRLKSGLSKTSSRLTEGVTGIFTKRKLDDDTLQDLEDLLVQSDLGVAMATRITDRLAEDRYDKTISPEEVNRVLADEIEAVLAPVSHPLQLNKSSGTEVILMVGVNGTGKTTTIGKLASKFKADGKSVMLAAGDTFRAAAVEQLKVWGERTNTEVITRDTGADAAGLAFDALQHAHANGVDVLMIDTAGRLQNKADLMSELEKILRVIRKKDETAPHHVLLVLDATTGQNALQQVEIFGKTAGVTGLVMTKLDGTARGGILVAIAEKYGLPVHAVGVGEGIDDLQPFIAREFAEAIAGNAQT